MTAPGLSGPSPVAAPRRAPKGGCARWALWGLMTVPVLVVVVAVGVVLLVKLMDRPPEVPSSFQVPTSLPVSTATVASGALAFDSDRNGNFELYSMAPDGTGVQQLTHDAAFDSWWPRISPDRRTIVFVRTPRGTHDRDYTQASVWAVAADGSSPVQLRPPGLDGWSQQGHPEWSPDGNHLVLFGGNRTSPQIFVTDPQGQHPTAITDRPGSNLDPSFSSDGRQVLFVGCPGAICTGGSQEIYRVPVSGGEATRITEDDLRDQDPYASPDGSRVAWLTQVEGGIIGSWDVRIADAEGRNPRLLAGDKGITSRAVWSADSQTLYVHRIPPGGTTFQIYAADASGGPLRELTANQPGSNEYPST
jgi:Tol biopolymer transport system component